ncbi:hypothetical protein SPRG_14970, partial [Saprolegnia parasitica CBS 223.65]
MVPQREDRAAIARLRRTPRVLQRNDVIEFCHPRDRYDSKCKLSTHQSFFNPSLKPYTTISVSRG